MTKTFTAVLAAIALAATFPVLDATAQHGAPHALGGDERPSAPDYLVAALTGERVSLSASDGQVTLVNFWATWCAPCAQEVPDLVRLQSAHAGRVRVIGLSVDEISRRPQVEAFTQTHRVNYPVAIADNQVIAAFGVVGVPTSFFIDANGRIANVHRGRVSVQQLETELISLTGLPAPR